MSTVAVNTRTHSVIYVADNILKSIKDILRLTGLNPAKLVESWDMNMRALKAWLDSQHLDRVTLEILDPKTNLLALRWDIDLLYNWGTGDGGFWTDTEQLRYHIRKAGLAPSEANYRLLMFLKPGAPSVSGWGDTDALSTDSMVRQSLGSTIEHNGLGASAGYWRRT